MLDPKLKSFIEHIPKAELHCHLEGAIQPSTLLKLAERNKIKLPFSDVAGAEKFYEFTNLNQFLEIFDLACSTLKTAEDFETITLELGADAFRQNIAYREVFFTYAYHERRGIAWNEVVNGIAAGSKKAYQQYGVEMRFIADLDRTIEPNDGIRTVEMAYTSRNIANIIGIGLDSQEIGFPAKRHAAAFQRAKELGFHRVAHAGEDVGPESVWDALTSLDVERIDHGVRSIEDPKLVELVAKRRIPLTVCPLSNICLKVYTNMATHPIKRLMDAGVLVTLNSDDPPMFHSNVLDNYFGVAETFDLDIDGVVELARNSFLASFLSTNEKNRYLKNFDESVSKLKASIFETKGGGN
jgi:adenosine deaminase